MACRTIYNLYLSLHSRLRDKLLVHLSHFCSISNMNKLRAGIFNNFIPFLIIELGYVDPRSPCIGEMKGDEGRVARDELVKLCL
jgi:hypothetical protein